MESHEVKEYSKQPIDDNKFIQENGEFNFHSCEEYAEFNFSSCEVEFLDIKKRNVHLSITKNTTGAHLFCVVCDKLGGPVDRGYFGLQYRDNRNQRKWLDLERNLARQLSSSNSNKLCFRVKYYPKKPLEDLQQEKSWHLLYLQIRRDLLRGRLICSPVEASYLGALILQVEYGDAPENMVSENDGRLTLTANSRFHTEQNYSQTFGESIYEKSLETGKKSSADVFFDCNIFYKQTAVTETQILKKYKTLKGLATKEAEIAILKRASELDTYGIDRFPVKIINWSLELREISASIMKDRDKETMIDGTQLHAFDKISGDSSAASSNSDEIVHVYLGLRHDGISTYIQWNLVETIPWNKIKHMAFDYRDFVVYMINRENDSTTFNTWLHLACIPRFRMDAEKLIFRCEDNAAAKAFWTRAMEQMRFFTLKASGQAKRSKTKCGLLCRSQSQKSSLISGKYRMDSKSRMNSSEAIPQKNIARMSSLRRRSRTVDLIDNPMISKNSKNRMEMFDQVNDSEEHRGLVNAVHMEASSGGKLFFTGFEQLQNVKSIFSSNDIKSPGYRINTTTARTSPTNNRLQMEKPSTSYSHHSLNSGMSVMSLRSLHESDEFFTSNGDLYSQINGTRNHANENSPVPPFTSEHCAYILFICIFLLLISVLETRAIEIWSKIPARFREQLFISFF